jgi:hypothetical protein
MRGKRRAGQGPSSNQSEVQMLLTRLSAGIAAGTASIILAAICGMSDAGGSQLLFAALSLVCIMFSVGLILDRDASIPAKVRDRRLD